MGFASSGGQTIVADIKKGFIQIHGNANTKVMRNADRMMLAPTPLSGWRVRGWRSEFERAGRSARIKEASERMFEDGAYG